MARVHGIHHITAISTDAEKNISFYTGIMGLRLVKVTVNFDDPSAYHLYYGDTVGTPGSALTFFIWKNMPKSTPGAGQIARTYFSIPPGTLDSWKRHFEDIHRESTEYAHDIFGKTIHLYDDDGMPIGLAEQTPNPKFEVWETKTIGKEMAIRGFAGVDSLVASPGYTSTFATDILGFETGKKGELVTDSQSLVLLPGSQRGAIGQGSVHHIAWEAETDEDELLLRIGILKAGAQVTPVIDRTYFHSIYFREPNGILFEIATKQPGFTLDEPKDKLGTSLQLPPMYQDSRAAIEAALPKIRLPNES